MWEFLFGQRKDEVLKQETVKIGDDFESRLRDSIEYKKVKEFRLDRVNAVEAYLRLNAWSQLTCVSFWHHKNYVEIAISHDIFSLSHEDDFILHDCTRGYRELGRIHACDNEAIPKLEAMLVTYKRVTAEVGTN